MLYVLFVSYCFEHGWRMAAPLDYIEQGWHMAAHFAASKVGVWPLVLYCIRARRHMAVW